MKSESDKILSMLEEGSITADEAQELLDAIEDTAYDQQAVGTTDSPPDMERIRSSWRIPFNISLVVMAISGSLLWRTRRAAGLLGLIRGLLLLPVTLIAGLSAAILYFSKDGPWVHLRVRSENNSRFALSLPFPIHWIRGGLRLAQSQVPDPEVGEMLDAAAEFLQALETSNLQDPVTIDIRDEGESVEIFLG